MVYKYDIVITSTKEVLHLSCVDGKSARVGCSALCSLWTSPMKSDWGKKAFVCFQSHYLVFLYYKVVYCWHNFWILVIILFFNSIKLIAMNCITWEFNSYIQAKQGRELHYSVMSSDKLAWRGTIKTVGMNVACVTETCHQHIGRGDSQCIFFPIRCPNKFGSIRTDEAQICPHKPGWAPGHVLW